MNNLIKQSSDKMSIHEQKIVTLIEKADVGKLQWNVLMLAVESVSPVVSKRSIGQCPFEIGTKLIVETQ